MENGMVNETPDEAEARHSKEIEVLFAEPDLSQTSRVTNHSFSIDWEDFHKRFIENIPAVNKAIDECFKDD